MILFQIKERSRIDYLLLRAENRLSVREDNVIDRLGEIRLLLGFETKP